MNLYLIFIVLLVLLSTSLVIYAQEQAPVNQSDASELAKKLSNPVANLISVPFQGNVDYGIGDYKGSKYTTNFQPVVPFALNEKINLITRYIFPIVDQHDITGEGNDEFGLSDATISAFFSPVKSKITWGVGPAFLIPTGTNDFLSTKKWGVGPTLVVLKQLHGRTIGLLANQIWSVAGDEDRSEVNQMFLQPFFTRSWPSGAGVNINSEMTVDWLKSNTTAWLNPSVSALTKIGSQTIQLLVGPRIPLSNQADFGFRGALIFVFPK